MTRSRPRQVNLWTNNSAACRGTGRGNDHQRVAVHRLPNRWRSHLRIPLGVGTLLPEPGPAPAAPPVQPVLDLPGRRGLLATLVAVLWGGHDPVPVLEGMICLLTNWPSTGRFGRTRR